jgi:N-ethylmaleimide reductase
MSSSAAKLFQPVTIGAWTLRNRITMAPLTRCRATPDTLAPNDLNTLYYKQRATAGLIITEATQISQEGQGYAGTPGIYSDAQVAGWKNVTDAVHKEGGTIVLQLWHVGRISHPSMQPNGGLPVAPSAIAPNVHAHTPTGSQPIPTPRALDISEMPRIVQDYAHAAEQSNKAGFDGIEIHGANGYLLDQFMRDSTNHRTDAYGGSVENRARLTLEVADALLKVWPKERIGIRLSPVSNANDISDSNPQSIFGYVIEQLNRRGLAYIHVIEGNTGGTRDVGGFDFVAARKAFKGAYIANNGYTRDLAMQAVDGDKADMIAFGKPFIANPDLVERLIRNAPLNTPDSKLFYGGDAHGYTDYPSLAA